jgi:hypothetical protein
VCIPSLSFQSVSHVSTLRPSESAAVLSGAPHEASSRASGTPTHLLITSLVALVVVHALNGSKSGSAATKPKFNENDLANLRATDERCVLRVSSGQSVHKKLKGHEESFIVLGEFRLDRISRVQGYSVSMEGTPEIGTEADGFTRGAGNEVAGAVVLTPDGVVAGATGDAAARSEDARSSPSRCFGVTRASASFL